MPGLAEIVEPTSKTMDLEFQTCVSKQKSPFPKNPSKRGNRLKATLALLQLKCYSKVVIQNLAEDWLALTLPYRFAREFVSS